MAATIGSRFTNLAEQINTYAKFPSTPVSLKQMVDFGRHPTRATLYRSSQFLLDELPIRLAKRVVQLENLPYGLSKTPSVVRVRDLYAQSFSQLVGFPRPAVTLLPPIAAGRVTVPSSGGTISSLQLRKVYQFSETETTDVDLGPEIEDFNAQFTRAIKSIKSRHSNVAITIAHGIHELRRMREVSLYDREIQSFLDSFYMSRIGIRMLIGQHVALAHPAAENEQTTQSNNFDFEKQNASSQDSNEGKYQGPEYVGIICTRTNIESVLRHAIDDARTASEEHYGIFDSPNVTVSCPRGLSFMYVPSHLHHMVFELLKNSMRAVIEYHHSSGRSGAYSPINVVVAEGRKEIGIKISDEGGGIPSSDLPFLWSYMYTTVKQNNISDENFSQAAENQSVEEAKKVQISANNLDLPDTLDGRAPMAGYGFGLPLSRLYARYFGGDLNLITMDGFGTDAYLRLCRLSDSEEPLPQ